MEKEIVDYVLKSEVKDRILGIEKFEIKSDELLKLFIDLYFYVKRIGIPELEMSKEEYDKEMKEKKHIIIILSDFGIDSLEEKIKIKMDLLKKLILFIKEKNYPFWIHILNISDIKEISMDSRFDLLDLIANGEIIYDKGVLEIFRLVSLHKNLLLETFSRYVVAYALAGSQVKGTNIESSDVDVYVIIDDTDVKQHTFEELKAKLYQIITSKALECQIILNSKKILHPQVYTLTEFWHALSEANPVIYTFLRDGIAFYDRGTFIAWKQLLLKGIIKPSREASDKYLSSADSLLKDVLERIKNLINSLIVENIALSMISASQSLLISYGLPPTDPKETIYYLRKIFVEENKLLEESYVKDVEKIWDLRKKFERGEIKEFEYKDLINYLNIAENFVNKIKEIKRIVDEKKEKEELIYYIEEYNALRARLESLNNKSVEDIIKEKMSNLLDLYKNVERDIKIYLDEKKEVNYNILKENIKILIKAFRDYLSGLIEDIITKYGFTIVDENGKSYTLIILNEKIYLISDKIEVYDYNGEKIEEMYKKDFNEIIKNINYIKRGIDEKTINLLKKIIGNFIINK